MNSLLLQITVILIVKLLLFKLKILTSPMELVEGLSLYYVYVLTSRFKK